jgi:hypothetical protein
LIAVAVLLSLAAFALALVRFSAAERPTTATGRATNIPATAMADTVYLVPLDGVSPDEVATVAAFFRARYGITIVELPATSIATAVNLHRGQVNIDSAFLPLASAFPEASGARAILIGITARDAYLNERPDWAWAFGGRRGDHRMALISTFRMGSAAQPASMALRDIRLRKMIGRYIGAMYYGLSFVSDPRSLMYEDVLGTDDLDRMAEEF